MRWRSIACSLLLAAGCGSTGGGDNGPDPMSGEVIKVTYVRFQSDQRTRRWVPEYRVMLSSSWHDRFGENPNEPYRKLFPSRSSRAPFLGMVPDEKMKVLLKELKRQGIDKLASVKPEEIDLVALSKIEKDPTEPQYTRIITVGTDKEHRSYVYRDNQTSVESIERFVGCERAVINMANLYTAQARVEANPITPKD